MKQKICALGLALVLAFSLLSVTALGAETSFVDVSGHWAESDIRTVVEKGLFQGTGPDTFSPNLGMDRGMFVTVLGRLAESLGLKISGDAGFSDVSRTAYFAPYVGWASDNGIVKGVGNGRFAPKTLVTREQMCAIFTRFLDYLQYKGPDGVQMTFADSDKISSYAVDAVRVTVALGLIQGSPSAEGMVFRPAASATRAEVAAVFCRLDRLEGLHDAQPTQPAEPPEEGGGGGGGGGSSSQVSQEEKVLEAEIAGYLQSMLNNYDGMTYLYTVDQPVRSCAATLMECIRTALASRSARVILTSAYVRSTYAEEIQQFKTEYSALTEDQKSQFDNVVVRLEKLSVIEQVMDYFGVKMR